MGGQQRPRRLQPARATNTGTRAVRAISNGSSPTSAARLSARTSRQAVVLRPWPRETTPAFRPRARR